VTAGRRNRLFRILREPVNALTHAVGIPLALTGLVLLLVLSGGEPWRTTSFAIYGASLVILYTASTLLHALKLGERGLRVLRIFDHAAIFGLIAGSYTPVALVTLKAQSPAWGWTLFGVVWGLALAGIGFKLFWIAAPRWLSTGLYLLLGWLALTAFVPLVRTMPPGGVLWLVLGGLFYSLGAVIYARKRPDPVPGVFGYHELWHLFVLAGSACHFVMMIAYILPIR
jgi:hemolysin III